MKKQKGFTLYELTIILLVLVGGWGWVWNVIKITESNFDVITGVLVIRVIGVFMVPLGAVMGFL